MWATTDLMAQMIWSIDWLFLVRGGIDCKLILTHTRDMCMDRSIRVSHHYISSNGDGEEGAYLSVTISECLMQPKISLIVVVLMAWGAGSLVGWFWRPFIIAWVCVCVCFVYEASERYHKPSCGLVPPLPPPPLLSKWGKIGENLFHRIPWAMKMMVFIQIFSLFHGKKRR